MEILVEVLILIPSRVKDVKYSFLYFIGNRKLLFELKLRMGIITQFKSASVVQTESRRIDSYAEVQPILADFQSAKITRISQIIYDYWDFNAEFNKIGGLRAEFVTK